MSLPMSLTPGTVVGGHYVIGNLINSGGFGAVYRGVDKSEGNRSCAIKETYDVTPAARRQALMEAGILFTIRSNHLPRVYDALEANGRFYLVMQLIEGQNLLEMVRSRVPSGSSMGQRGPCTEQEVLRWLLPVIEVLQELHSRRPSIIHRDIKPGNIILNLQQDAVLVDFGLTKIYDPVGTQTMVKAVSEGFSPIEQYMGSTSPQSDIYAMAATIYFLLTNVVPPAAVGRSVRDELRAPRQINPSLSVKMERVLLKALSVNADQRYQSMDEFGRALKEPASNFNAYANPTVAAPATPPLSNVSVPPPPPPAQQSSHPYPSSSPYPQPMDPYQSSQSPNYGTRFPSSPQQMGQYSAPIYGSYPHLPQNSVPPGYVMVPQSALYPVQALPSPYGQGCLWGLLQGIIAGLLVLFLKRAGDFYLATLIGFLFYAIAGLRTTRKGGSLSRGGWGGYWAGINGTIVFWVTLGIGLAIRFSQNVQNITSATPDLQSNRISERAWREVKPDWPNIIILQSQPDWVNIIILIVGGMLVAWLIGWLGGWLGKGLFAAMQENKKKSSSSP